MKYQSLDNDNEKLDASLYKLYENNTIEQPYRNPDLYDNMKQKKDLCDITPTEYKYFKKDVCDSNLIVNEFDLDAKIKSIDDRRVDEVDEHMFFNEYQKKYVELNDHILDDLKNKRLADLQKDRKNLKEEYIKNQLIINEKNEKMKYLKLWLFILLILLIPLLITLFLYIYKIAKKKYRINL